MGAGEPSEGGNVDWVESRMLSGPSGVVAFEELDVDEWLEGGSLLGLSETKIVASDGVVSPGLEPWRFG